MSYDSVIWLSVGPSAEIEPGSDKVSGRVKAIAISADFDGKGTPAMFIGIDGGGVWRSQNFQEKEPEWSPLTDSLALNDPTTKMPLDDAKKTGLSTINSLVVDQSNSRHICAATDHGILESYDGGDSWNLLYMNSIYDGWIRIQKIFIDPTDSSGKTIYTLCGGDFDKKSIYVSTDGGKKWNEVHYNLGYWVDIVDIDYTFSGKSLTLYATQDGKSVWQSTDNGTTWKEIPIPSTIDPKTIDSVKFAADHSEGAAKGVYVAFEGSSVVISVCKLVWGVFTPVGTGFPSNFNIMSGWAIGLSSSGVFYLGAGDVEQLIDDNANWTLISNGSNKIAPHADHHAWASYVDPATGVESVYNGNDGGIYRFTPLPNGKPGPGTWEGLNTRSLITNLVYQVGLHPTRLDVLLAGNQDNGTARLGFGTKWRDLYYGDTFRVRIDPNHGDFAYFCGSSPKFLDPKGTGNYTLSGLFFFSNDSGATWNDISNNLGLDSSYVLDRVPPFAIDPGNSLHLVLGLHEVWETKNRGLNWIPISPNLYGTVYGMRDIAVLGSMIVVVADDVFISVNGGGSWTLITHDWNGSKISSAVIKHTNEIYLASDGGSVWRLTFNPTDGSAKIDDLSGPSPRNTADSSLPYLSLHSIALTGSADPDIFVGTDVGVYVSTDQGATWQRLGQGFPDVKVNDLQYSPWTYILAAATWGRGIFLAQLSPPIKIPQVILAINRILLGISNDAPGYYMTPDGKIHPWGPGDPAILQTGTVSLSLQNILNGLAFMETAYRITDRKGREKAQREALSMMQLALKNLTMTIDATSEKRQAPSKGFKSRKLIGSKRKPIRGKIKRGI